jgi:hypothetical protein
VRVPPEVGDRVEALVDTFVNDVSTVTVRGAAYWRLVRGIESIGAREIAATANISDRLLRRPVRSMTGLLEGRSALTKALATMRRAVAELDPARFDLPRMTRGDRAAIVTRHAAILTGMRRSSRGSMMSRC